MKLVHWPLMGGMLHLVQWGGDWAGPQPAQSLPRCIKCSSPPINGQCTNQWSFALQFHVPVKGLNMFLSLFTACNGESSFNNAAGTASHTWLCWRYLVPADCHCCTLWIWMQTEVKTCCSIFFGKIIIIIIIIYLDVKRSNKNTNIVRDGSGQQGRNCANNVTMQNKTTKWCKQYNKIRLNCSD